MAATEMVVVMYQGSWGRRIIATIMAVRTAPLGNSRFCSLAQMITASNRPATVTALKSPGATARMPSCGAAIATSMTRIMVSRPLGVRKNFHIAQVLRRTAQSFRLEPFQGGRHDQTFYSHPMKELNPRFRTQHECGGCERVSQHRVRRNHARTRNGARGLAVA